VGKHSDIILTPSLEKRFWKYVPDRPDSGCWHWQGQALPAYGRMFGGGGVNKKHLLAHRVSWVIHHGDIPRGSFVCHHCDNKSCVRPDHLHLCSAKENSREAVDRGRFDNYLRNRAKDGYRGERNAMARLTREDVRRIRYMYRAGGTRQRDLAEEFGVTRPHISGILSGKFWGWLPDEA
jgi:hypothetical protein